MPPPLYMDAVIRPNRSLGRSGYRVVMGVLIVANLMLAAMFLRLGALLVPVFLGLDVLAVWLAFRASFRASERSEHVQVTAEAVTVSHQSAAGRRAVWRSPTAFTRVTLERPEEHEARVRLALSAKRLTVGRALSPPERVAFARALQRAIDAARAERNG